MKEGLVGWEKYQAISPVINKSYIYLFPMIGLTNGVTKSFFINLEGVFLLNEDFISTKDKIYLLFKKNYTTEFSIFIQGLLNAIYYSFSYEPDSYHIIYAFDIPYEYKREYIKFIESKYSEFSDNYKKSILKFHGFSSKGEGKSIYNILYKHEDAYLDMEKTINHGLPSSSWIQIPRTQEIGRKWDENDESIYLETYSKDMKIIFEDKYK